MTALQSTSDPQIPVGFKFLRSSGFGPAKNHIGHQAAVPHRSLNSLHWFHRLVNRKRTPASATGARQLASVVGTGDGSLKGATVANKPKLASSEASLETDEDPAKAKGKPDISQTNPDDDVPGPSQLDLF